MGVIHLAFGHDGQEHCIDYDTDDGVEVLKLQLYSLTLIPPENQVISVGESIQIESDADILHLVSEGMNKLRLEDVTKSPIPSTKPSTRDVFLQEKADEEYAHLLQAEEDALQFQQVNAIGNKEDFKRRVQPHIQTVMLYEDPGRQEAAQKSVPTDELEERAAISLAKEGNFKPTKAEQDHAFLLQLLFWFKRSFRWVNQPSCDRCGFETVEIGMGRPTSEEQNFGAGRVELYRCKMCSEITRFPRYNDPIKILETRRGRCGEWANCFTLYCRAFKYEARLAVDFTDHVWTECFSNQLHRWMHLDPCEGVFDQPLLYEQGWNKKLTYVISLSRDGVYDVTRRYTMKWFETLRRRLITTESNVQEVVSSLTKEIRRNFSSAEKDSLEARDIREQDELESSHQLTQMSCPLPGRQSGSIEWRVARSEIDLDNNKSLKKYCCPWRTCIDVHVGKVYESIGLLVSECLNFGLSVEHIIKQLQRILRDLQAKPFRSRKLIVGLGDKVLAVDQIVNIDSFQKFLKALSLQSIMDEIGRMTLSLGGEPVVTSLALAVALDVLDELVNIMASTHTVAHCRTIQVFADYRRVCSGMVQASGEQLPSGIVTSAFDGLSSTKWEEPEGGKEAQITYKLESGPTQELVAYQLTSANDAPERDPMDWILEGSSDEGITWHVLDTQKSQTFEERFLRKTFMITTEMRLCNSFRFKFSSVLDPVATNRLQIARVDLFAKQR